MTDNEVQSGALRFFTELLNEQLEAEVIGGVSVASVLGAVDLDIAFTPVVPVACGERYEFDVPETVEVQQWDGQYALVWPEQHDFERVSADSLKVMRARFLLLRDHYYRRLRSMPHSMRSAVLGRFFGGSVWQPAAGSALSKAMGLE